MKGFYCELVVTEQIANGFGCCKMYLSRALSVGGCHNSLTDSASRDYEESRNEGLARRWFSRTLSSSKSSSVPFSPCPLPVYSASRTLYSALWLGTDGLLPARVEGSPIGRGTVFP